MRFTACGLAECGCVSGVHVHLHEQVTFYACIGSTLTAVEIQNTCLWT